MEDLLGFIFVILGIVASIIKNQKKKQQDQARKQVRQEIASQKQKKAPYSMEALQAWFEEQEKEDEAPAVPAAAGLSFDMGEKTHEGLHPCDEHSAAPARVAQPRIQARVQVTEKPAVVTGSMGTDSHEGIHPCDTHGTAPRMTEEPLLQEQTEEGGLRLDWTGENMVKAFIMQEVLTRPAQRRRA